MAISIKIGGVDLDSTSFKRQNDSISISENLKGTNQLRLKLIGNIEAGKPKESSVFEMKDGNNLLFAGVISKVQISEISLLEKYSHYIEVSDWTYVFNEHVVLKSFDNKTAKFILSDLISNVVPLYKFTLDSEIDDTIVIPRLAFNYITLTAAMNKIATALSCEWWISYEKVIYLRKRTLSPAPYYFDFEGLSSSNYEKLTNINFDSSQIKNYVIVRGGKDESQNSTVEEFVCDGSQRSFTLREKPRKMVSIELYNGTSYSTKTFGVDHLDEETSKEFLFSFQEKYVRLTETQTTPPNLNRVRITYKGEVPIVVPIKDSGSIAAMKLIEGTDSDGIHTAVISDTSISSRKEAQMRAQAEIQTKPLINGMFVTRSDLLGGGRLFIGQSISYQNTKYAINTPIQLPIQNINTVIEETTDGPIYRYTINFGGKPFDINDALLGIASKTVTINDQEELDRIELVGENLGIDDAITSQKYTGTFLWGGSVWGKFEWNS